MTIPNSRLQDILRRCRSHSERSEMAAELLICRYTHTWQPMHTCRKHHYCIVSKRNGAVVHQAGEDAIMDQDSVAWMRWPEAADPREWNQSPGANP